MKTMRYFALAAVVAALAGCSKQEPAQIEIPGADHEVYLTVRASSADTRTAISPDYAIRWAEGDAIGLFYDTKEIQAEWGFSEGSYTLTNGTTQNLYYPIASGVSTSAADFSYQNYIVGSVQHPASGYYSGNFYWLKGVSQATLYAYYPYYYDAVAGSAYNVESMPFLIPMTQSGSLDDVAANDLACASATIMRGEGNVVKGEADFQFHHLLSILEITVENQLDETVTVESVDISAAEDVALAGNCTVNLVAGTLDMGKGANSSGEIEAAVSSTVKMKPSSGVVLSPRGVTKLYAIVAPGDLSGATVHVTTSGGYQDFAVAGINTEAGMYYKKSVSLTDLKPNPSMETIVIDFEDDYWSAFVAANLGVTYTSDITSDEYNWTDPLTGMNTPSIAGAYGMTGRFVVSSYNSSDIQAYGSFTYDLYVYNATNEDAVSGGGYGGSDNFIIGYGSKSSMGDHRPSLKFSDGVARTIEYCYVNNICYMLNTSIYGDAYASPLEGDEKVEIYATGYDAVGMETGTVSMVVATAADYVGEWTKLDLSSLGDVVSVRFDMTGKNNAYGLVTPAYYAIDNITVTQEKK